MSKKKKDVAAIVSATGFIGSFITSLWDEMEELCGTDEMYYKLVQPEGRDLVRQIAELIVDSAITVSTAYGINNAIALSFDEMVQSAKFDHVDKEFTQEHFPLEDQSKNGEEIFLMHFARYANLGSVLDKMKSKGFRPATSRHALAFAFMHSEIQQKFPVVFLGTAWDCDPNFHVNEGFATLSVKDNNYTQRALYVDYSCDGWGEDCRFAVVRI